MKESPIEAHKIGHQKIECQKIKPPVKRKTPSLEPSDSDASLHCKTCVKSFSNTENLSLHVKSVHGRKKPHKCHFCGVSFSQNYILLMHFKDTLHDKRSINCKFCDCIFFQKTNLENHIATVHEGKEPYNWL